MPSSRDSSRSRSSSPPSPTTPDPRRPLLPQTITQLPSSGVPLRYAWRGKMTWPLRGDPRRYSTFPPYVDGNPIINFGRNVASWLLVAFWWLAAVLKITLWNFPAGIVIGIFVGVILCKHSDIKILQPNAPFPVRPTVPTIFSYGAQDTSVFIQSANDVVDQAWRSIGANMRNIVVQDSELTQGLDLNKSHVRVAKHYGGGYVMEVEGFRSIHCLNVLRKSLYFNARKYSEVTARSQISEKELREEIDVCLNTLRQQLMCLVDSSAHGFVWVDPASSLIAPDLYRSRHLCYDFHKVRHWAESRQVPKTLPEDYYQLFTGED